MNAENIKIKGFSLLFIIIGIAFFIGFIIKLRTCLFDPDLAVECFLAIVNFFCVFYLAGGIGFLRNKRWSVVLIKLLSLTWLAGILEALFFSIIIPRSILLSSDKYFFAWPLGIIIDMHKDFPGLEILPIVLFLPFIILPYICLHFCSSPIVKDRFKIEPSKKEDLIIRILALCAPLLIYFVTLKIWYDWVKIGVK